jgi:hypothetical protein
VAIVNAVSPNGIGQSTANVADALWETAQTELRRVAFDRGYTLEVLDYVPEPGSSYAVERNCDDLASAREWIGSLNPDED